MGVKLFRVFMGGYTPDREKLLVLKYKTPPQSRRLISVFSGNHGFGKVTGVVKKLGISYSPVPICVFRRDNRQLLWEIKSKADGSYAFRNIAVGLECFVVAFDPNNQYNAVIQDKVIAK